MPLPRKGVCLNLSEVCVRELSSDHGIAQMQIGWIEHGCRFQARPVEDRQMAALKLDQTLTPSTLELQGEMIAMAVT